MRARLQIWRTGPSSWSDWQTCLADTSSQGGILVGSLGARLPRNLQTHTKFLQQFTLFWRKFDLKVRISCQMKEFFLSHTTCRKYFLVTGRNFLALQLINCHRKKFIVTERNHLSRAEISCHKKKFFVAGGNFLSQELSYEEIISIHNSVPADIEALFK